MIRASPQRCDRRQIDRAPVDAGLEYLLVHVEINLETSYRCHIYPPFVLITLCLINLKS